MIFDWFLLCIYWWLYVAILFYSKDNVTWENLNFRDEIVTLCIYIWLSITCTNREEQLYDWFKEKRLFTNVFKFYCITFFLQQNCLLIRSCSSFSISLYWFMVRWEVVMVVLLGGQQLESKHFSQISSE